MKQNNLFSFGCSMSAPYMNVTEQDTYGYLLANKLGYIPYIKSRAGSGLEFSKNELIKALPFIKKGDIVIFQFTFHFRLEFWEDIHNEDSWFSTAGFYQMSDLKNHPPHSPLRRWSNSELEIMLKYNSFFRIQEKPILIKPIQNLLHYLEQKGVRYLCLYASHEDDEYFVDKNTITLPCSDNPTNNGIVNFVRDKKITLGDEFSNEYKDDPHPGFEAHRQIADILYKELV